MKADVVSSLKRKCPMREAPLPPEQCRLANVNKSPPHLFITYLEFRVQCRGRRSIKFRFRTGSPKVTPKSLFRELLFPNQPSRKLLFPKVSFPFAIGMALFLARKMGDWGIVQADENEKAYIIPHRVENVTLSCP